MSSRRLYEPSGTLPISDRESGLSGYDEDLERDETPNTRNQDKQETRRSSPKKTKSRRAKKNEKTKSKKSKSKKYVMISTSMDGDHSEESDDEDEDEDEDDEQDNGNQSQRNAGAQTRHTTNINNGNGCTSLQNVDCEFDEIKLTSSISPNNLVDIDIDGDEDKHLNGHRQQTANGMIQQHDIDIDRELSDIKNATNKYGVSAYYGARLDYRNKKCHDMAWSIAWVLHCIAIGVVLVVVWTSEHVHMPHASGGVFLLSFLLAFAVIFACVCTFLLKYCGGFTIWILIIGCHIFLAAFAAFCFIVGDRFRAIGIIFTIVFVLFAVFTLLIRRKISYTIALLQLGHSILVTTPSAFAVSFGVLVTQIAWLFVWGSIVVAFAAQYQHTNSSSDFWGIIMVLTLSFVWTHQVIKNIGHVTISAVIAHWYFTPQTDNKSESSSSPTCAALWRALTTSLGSVVYGSLFINVLQALSSYTRALRDGCGCLQCYRYCLTCCLTACDGLLEYFNHYAFVHVAVYGTAYMKSGKQTFDLLTMAKIHQLMNANYTEFALLCGSVCGGVMNSILASYVSNVMNFSTDWVVLFTCGGLLIGMSISNTLLNSVSSCIMALFVLYAEEPSLLNELHPEQALRFDGAQQGIV